MFIHGFEGAWLEYPFWRTRFLLERPRDLELLKASGISAVVIDASRGAGVDRPASPMVAAAHPGPSLANAPAGPWKGSASDTRADKEQARRTIARAKQAIEALFDAAREGRMIDATTALPVVAEISECVERNPPVFIDMSRLRPRDDYVSLHAISVCALMINLARQIALDEERVLALGLAGLLHDVGMMTVPLAVLNKAGELSAEEHALIRAHPERGHAMLSGGAAITPEVLDVALLHHERMDGQGYPFGLEGEAISLAARMAAICDVFDALTSDRAYKDRWTPLHAVTEMHRLDGHFDRALLFDFFCSVGVVPSGMLVRMRTNRLGLTLPDGANGTRSKVRVFHSAFESTPVALEDVFPSLGGAGDRILAAEDPDRCGFSDWEVVSEQLRQGRAVRRRF
jgi:HD-GYP domain-containing protein (c-di-GMP phosphodiesterase class II)